MTWVTQVDEFLDSVPIGGTFTVGDFYDWLPSYDDENAGIRLQVHRDAQLNSGTRNVAHCEQRGRYAFWRRLNHTEYERARSTVAQQGIGDLVKAFACEALAAAADDPATYIRAKTEINAAVTMMNAALAFMGIPPVAAP